MNERQAELLAALAVGAEDVAELQDLAGKLAASPQLRKAFAPYGSAAEFVALSAHAEDGDLSDERKARMLARIISGAAASRREPDSAYSSMVPWDRLLQFSPGIEWAVLPGEHMTVVYWVFTPPDCGDLPLETHAHEQSGYVLDGKFTLLYAHGEDRSLRTGEHYRIPSGAAHGAIFHERTLLCDVYVPKRDDFERMYAEQRNSGE